MDENMLLASGPTATADLYSTAGFFASLANQDTLDFHGQYAGRFGIEAPALGSLGESCYEGVLLLAALIERARHARRVRDRRGGGHRVVRGAARLLRLRGSHVRQRIYLARADGVDFDVVAQLDLHE
jgi:urea transport system substrate-binding protein